MNDDPSNHKMPATDSELEIRLSRALARLPDAPVPSNFTARVMQSVELEAARRLRKGYFVWNWRAFFPRLAVAAAIVFFAAMTVQRYELNAHRSALAKNVALVADAQPLPSVDALKNFDAIQRMSQPRADDELLALMQ